MCMVLWCYGVCVCAWSMRMVYGPCVWCIVYVYVWGYGVVVHVQCVCAGGWWMVDGVMMYGVMVYGAW